MERYNIQWSAKTLCNQMKKGLVNFDNAVQRSLVWDNSRKSLLIHSMIYGYAIPAMYFTKGDDGIYDSLDGKQRSNAIYEFINDEFALSEDTPDVYDGEGNIENISGMTFSQLPEWAQDKVKEYSLTIYYYQDMSEAEIREFFRRLNNGKPLSAVELTRVNTPSLVKFQELAKHEAIQAVTTEAAKKRFTDENIAMQIYHMFTEEKPDFSTKCFREWAKSVEVDDATMKAIKTGLDAYMGFFKDLELEYDNKKIIRTVKSRTNFVSTVYFCAKAQANDIWLNEIILALQDFWSGKPSTNDEYNKSVGAGSAKPGAVQTRKRVMDELVLFIKEK